RAGFDARDRADPGGDLVRQAFGQIGNRAHGLLARDPGRGRRRRRLVRRTSVVPTGREQFLVLQFAPRPARLRDLPRGVTPARRAIAASRDNRDPARAAGAVVSGSMICAVALLVVAAVLPHADLLRGAAGVGSPSHLAAVALANTVVLVAGYLAAAALIWGIADATMAQPRDLEHFDE